MHASINTIPRVKMEFQIELQEGEIYRRTDFSHDEEPPSITIVDGNTIVAVSPTVYYSIPIPEGGVPFAFVFRMRAFLNVHGGWIVGQLNRAEFGGAAGPLIARTAQNIDTTVGPRATPSRVPPQVIQPPRPFPVLRVLDKDNTPDDDDCVICVGTECQTTWATCAGCDFH